MSPHFAALHAGYVRRIWAARPDATGAWATEVLLALPPAVNTISSFGEDDAGELYLLDYGNGKIWALDGPPPGLPQVVSRKTHGSAVKARANQPLDASNFRFDVNASGGIDTADLSAVKAKSGQRIP